MQSLKVLSIVSLIVTVILVFATLGGASDTAIGFWILSVWGLVIALSIVGIVQANKVK